MEVDAVREARVLQVRARHHQRVGALARHGRLEPRAVHEQVERVQVAEAVLLHRLCDADGRVADEAPHLQRELRADEACEGVEETTDRREHGGGEAGGVALELVQRWG